MSQNKTPEELLKEFNNLDVPKEDNNVNTASDLASNFVKFIIRCSIKPGNEPFKIIFLYRLYRTLYKDDIRIHEFTRRLRDYVHVNSNIGFCYIDLQKYEGLTPNEYNEEKDKGQVNLLNNRRLLKYLQDFFKEFNIIKGNYPVPTLMLFSAFNSWKKNKGLPCNKMAFFKLLRRNFEVKTTQIAHYTSLEFTDELRKIITEDEIKEFIKKRRFKFNKNKRRNKRKAIKQAEAGKVSSIKSKVQFKDPSGTT